MIGVITKATAWSPTSAPVTKAITATSREWRFSAIRQPITKRITRPPVTLFSFASSLCNRDAHRRAFPGRQPQLLKRGYQSVDSPKRIGHGIGMARAEPPSLNEVETEIHRSGMILALEPKVRSEKSAVHLEEDVLIAERGPEFWTSGCLGRRNH